jgi:hypothetical protein
LTHRGRVFGPAPFLLSNNQPMRKSLTIWLALLASLLGFSAMAYNTFTVFNSGSSNITVTLTGYIAGNSLEWDGLINSQTSHTWNSGATTVAVAGWFRCQYAAMGTCTAYDSGYLVVSPYFTGDTTTMIGTGCITGTNCLCPANPGCNYFKVKVSVCNNSSVRKTYQLRNNNGYICQGVTSLPPTGEQGSGGYVDPGQTSIFNTQVCDTNGLTPVELIGPILYGVSGSGDSTCVYWMSDGGNGGWARTMDPTEYAVTSLTTGSIPSDPTPKAPVNDSSGAVGGYTPSTNNATGGTNGINWAADVWASQASNTTVKALVNGFGALYSSDKSVEQKLGVIASEITKLDNDTRTNGMTGGSGTNGASGTNDLSGVTNLLGQMLTAERGLTNQMGNLAAILGVETNNTAKIFGGVTNLLAPLLSMSNSVLTLTNLIGLASMASNSFNIESNQWNLETNLIAQAGADGWTNLGGSYSTNGADAWAQGVSDAATVKGTLDGMSTEADGIGGGLTDPGGSDTFTIQTGLAGFGVPDYTIDFLVASGRTVARPSFAGLAALMKTLWTYLLYLGYAYWIAKTLVAASSDLFTARGVAVMPMNVEVLGIGGNVAGGMLWAFVVVAVLVVWAAALALLFTTSIGGQDWPFVAAQLTGDPLAGATGSMGSGVHWVYSTFPLRLAVSLLAARMSWRFTMIYVVAATRFAMRWLPGA